MINMCSYVLFIYLFQRLKSGVQSLAMVGAPGDLGGTCFHVQLGAGLQMGSLI